MNYWDYNGYRRRGEFVAHVDAAGQIAAALADMYAAELPLRSLYRVDRWGYSRRVHGGDDLASMDAGNTSVFNCRDVVNRPGVRSPHSWGRALDLNTWENPYRSQQGHRAERLVAVALAPAGGLALELAPGRPDHGRPRAALDLRPRRHPALRRAHRQRPLPAPGRLQRRL